MKTLKTQLGRLLRLSTAATVLIFSQQAMAVGTDAGTPINNTALIDYQVNGAPQAQLNAAAPQFLVDRVVTFTIAATDSANTVVAPNEQDAVAEFTITNTSNSPLDFRLLAANLIGTTGINSSTDTTDVETDFVYIADNDGDGTLGSAGDDAFVDALAEGASILVGVFADVPPGAADNAVAHISLTAFAADPGAILNPGQDGSLGGDLAESGTNDEGTIETVFNDAGEDGNEIANDGYVVNAAVLTITKDVDIVDDPINTAAPYFAIPGATVEYTITLSNAGSGTATNVEIDDTLTAELLFSTANLPSGTGNVSITEGGTTTYCTAEIDTDSNSDGCVFNSGTNQLEVDGRDQTQPLGSQPVTISVGNVDDVIIRFRATIDPT